MTKQQIVKNKRGQEVLAIAIAFCAMLVCVSALSFERIEGENSLSQQRLGGSLALPERQVVDGQYFAVVIEKYYDDGPDSIFDWVSALEVESLFELVPILSSESILKPLRDIEIVMELEEQIEIFFALEMPDVATPYRTHGGVI